MTFLTVPSFWIELSNITELVKEEKTLFPVVKLAYICIPTFPYGQATFVLRSLNNVSQSYYFLYIQYKTSVPTYRVME